MITGTRYYKPIIECFNNNINEINRINSIPPKIRFYDMTYAIIKYSVVITYLYTT